MSAAMPRVFIDYDMDLWMEDLDHPGVFHMGASDVVATEAELTSEWWGAVELVPEPVAAARALRAAADDLFDASVVASWLRRRAAHIEAQP